MMPPDASREEKRMPSPVVASGRGGGFSGSVAGPGRPVHGLTAGGAHRERVERRNLLSAVGASHDSSDDAPWLKGVPSYPLRHKQPLRKLDAWTLSGLAHAEVAT